MQLNRAKCSKPRTWYCRPAEWHDVSRDPKGEGGSQSKSAARPTAGKPTPGRVNGQPRAARDGTEEPSGERGGRRPRAASDGTQEPGGGRGTGRPPGTGDERGTASRSEGDPSGQGERWRASGGAQPQHRVGSSPTNGTETGEGPNAATSKRVPSSPLTCRGREVDRLNRRPGMFPEPLTSVFILFLKYPHTNLHGTKSSPPTHTR